MKETFLIFCIAMCSSCVSTSTLEPPFIPAQEFTQAMHRGQMGDFSMAKSVKNASHRGMMEHNVRPIAYHSDSQGQRMRPPTKQSLGDPRFVKQGFQLKHSIEVPSEQIKNIGGAVSPRPVAMVGQYSPPPPAFAGLPPGSASPYYMGQMTANPSLWPDEAQGASLYIDHRAFQPMDVITIIIDESTKGKKKAETDAESKYSILAGISKFFGVETKDWKANNTALDPTSMIEAKTNVKFEGDGEMKRSGTLSAQISAVIMEVFPNGLMRIEGTKIVSLDSEEEIIVISGLVRRRDVGSDNRVDSNRIANMRIDFYGQGLLREHQEPGWGARLFEMVWPF